MPHHLTTLTTLTSLLEASTTRVVTWLEPLGEHLMHSAGKESALSGWTIRELAVHVAKSMDAIILSEQAPPGIAPMTLAEYLGTYPGRAQEIAVSARDASAQVEEGSLFAYMRSQFAAAGRTIAAYPADGDTVVAARRGPVTLHDLVISRLIEVVVHASDLRRSFTGIVDMSAGNVPDHAEAQRVVANELLDIIITRGGYSLEVSDVSMWIDLATGRRPYNTAELAQALSPKFTAGGIPDLGRMLPIV